MVQVRDLYWTVRNFRNRVADFLRYRWDSLSLIGASVAATSSAEWGMQTAVDAACVMHLHGSQLRCSANAHLNLTLQQVAQASCLPMLLQCPGLYRSQASVSR